MVNHPNRTKRGLSRKEHDVAFEAGNIAFHQGKPCFTPYMRDLERADAWRSGWQWGKLHTQNDREQSTDYDPTCVFCQTGEEPGHEH